MACAGPASCASSHQSFHVTAATKAAKPTYPISRLKVSNGSCAGWVTSTQIAMRNEMASNSRPSAITRPDDS